MSRLRVQCILEAESEKREDDVMNVFHFQTASPADESNNYDPLVVALGAFYDGLGQYLADHRKAAMRVRIFDLADPSPRAPVHEDTVNITRMGGTYLPNEVACVLSLYAAEASGVPRGRRRGRLYLGPFVATANSTVGRPVADLIDDILLAAQGLATATNGAFPSPGGWQIYSPTDDIMRQVVRIAVDDAWDIQRRRGIDPLSRTVQDVAIGP